MIRCLFSHFLKPRQTTHRTTAVFTVMASLTLFEQVEMDYLIQIQIQSKQFERIQNLNRLIHRSHLHVLGTVPRCLVATRYARHAHLGRRDALTLAIYRSSHPIYKYYTDINRKGFGLH